MKPASTDLLFMYERARTTPASHAHRRRRVVSRTTSSGTSSRRYHRVAERLANLEKLSPSFLESSPIFTARREQKRRGQPRNIHTECSATDTRGFLQNRLLASSAWEYLISGLRYTQVDPFHFSTDDEFSTLSLALFRRETLA